jgi:hypothetical protein
MGQFLAPDPTKVHLFFDDFDTYTAGQWTVTETNAAATEALTDGDGGLLLITNTNLENDAVSMQKVGESFLMATGKKAWFKTRFQVSEGTQVDLLMGLAITDTTPLNASDGVFFRKDDGDTNVDFIVVKNSVESSLEGVGTMASGTNIILGWYYDGLTTFYIYVNDVLVGTLSYTAASFPNDEELTVTMHHETGAAGAQTMTVDYILAAKER